MKNATVKWAAELMHVREISLFGTADLAFWKDRLQKEDLVPVASEGKAQLWIVAADSKYMGVRFAELSFSVLVSQHEKGTRRDGAFLVQAFNSCRFFAFCERTFFATPYEHGDVRVEASFPACIQLRKGGEDVFRAAMPSDASALTRKPSRSAEDGWEGPVFLPRRGRGNGRGSKLFFARVQGHTETYAFLRDKDSIEIRPSPGGGILQALFDSDFSAHEWAVRLNATHAKSKTYQQTDWVIGEPK
jgi:hypothetical protein